MATVGKMFNCEYSGEEKEMFETTAGGLSVTVHTRTATVVVQSKKRRGAHGEGKKFNPKIVTPP